MCHIRGRSIKAGFLRRKSTGAQNQVCANGVQGTSGCKQTFQISQHTPAWSSASPQESVRRSQILCFVQTWHFIFYYFPICSAFCLPTGNDITLDLLHKLGAVIFHAQAAGVFHTSGCVVDDHDHWDFFQLSVSIYFKLKFLTEMPQIIFKIIPRSKF